MVVVRGRRSWASFMSYFEGFPTFQTSDTGHWTLGADRLIVIFQK